MKKLLSAFLLIVTIYSFGQTNPTPQSLPYSQNFGTTSFNSMPAGMAAWQGGQRTSLSQAEGSTPGANATVGAQTNTTTTGGIFGYAVSSNARVYIQQSSNATNGTNQVALSINTGSANSINISYDVELLNLGASTNSFGLVLQYHQGNVSSNAWTTVSGSTLLIAGGQAFSPQTFSFNISSLITNTDYQLRWAAWRPGSGNSCGIGIDNINISSAILPTSTVSITGADPNSTPLNWSINSINNIFYSATIAPTSANATLTSVSSIMGGTYLSGDISSNGFKLWYSADANFTSAFPDVQLGSGVSSSTGAGETITWTGLSQTFTASTNGYIYATADISPGATQGNILNGSFSSTANIVFTPTVSYGANSFGSTVNKTFAVLPTNPSVFATTCSSEAKVSVNMNVPTVGNVVVFANTSGIFTDPTGSGSSFTGANLNYSSASNYPAVGGNLIYSGSGASFDMTGLSATQVYYLKAYSYSGSNWSSGTSVINGTAITQPVTATVVTPTSGQLQLSWTNPNSNACYNNVIVLARQGSPVESQISKSNFDGLVSDADFTGANTVWTSNSNTNDVFDLTFSLLGTDNTNYHVYKGTGNSVTLTGLTNGSPYYFRIFTVDGSGSAARWSNGVDAVGFPDVPGYYWNGGSISAFPANGGTGTWGTSNSWRQPGAYGNQANWADNNPAVFAGTAGTITLDADRTASSYSFNTTSYTLQTTSTAARTLTGPITVLNNGELVIAPNPALGSNGTIGFGNVNGSGTASITIFGNQTSGNAARVNIAAVNSTVNLPTNIVTSTGNGLAGYVATATGVIVNGNITNNSALTTVFGATSGNNLTFNGVLSGTSGLQISAGASGGAGVILFNNNNTYSGNTTFNAAVSGTVQIGTSNAFPSNSNFNLSASTSNGGNFDLNGFDQTIGSLTNGVVNSCSITNNSSISNSTLSINQSGNTTFGLRFRNGSGGRTLAINKLGNGILTLSNNDHDITGGLFISGGELRFNPSTSPVNLTSCNTLLNGGILGTSGISASSVLNYSAMVVNNTSTVSLSTSSSHTITFVNSTSSSWNPASTLIIVGWQGNYTTTAGSPGTVGRIFVGNNASALTTAQLDQIKFFNGTTYYDANLLSNGELVPGSSDLTQLSSGFCGYTAQNNTEFIWADSIGTPSINNNYRYKFKLVNGASTLTWTTNNQWPIMQFYLISGYSPGTTYTTSVAWSNDFGSTFSDYGPTCNLTSPSSPTTQLSVGSCGSSPATFNTLLFADAIGGATQYQYRLINTSLSYTQTFTKTNNNFILSQFTGLQNNTTYSVDVAVNMGSGFGPFGNVCSVTTPGAPTTQLSSGSCGSSPATFNTLLFADAVGGATQYQYRLINTSLSYTQTFTKTNNNFILSQFAGLQNNTTYSVDVSVNIGNGFGPFGSVCNVTTPGAPTTQLSSGSCGSSPANFNTLLFADAVGGATQYQFRLINTSLSYTQTFTKSNNNFVLSQFTGLQNNTTYTVQVAVNMGSGFGQFGSFCNVLTPGAPTTQLSAGSCGSSPSSFTTTLFADAVGGATQYEYLLTNTSLAYSQSYVKPQANLNLSLFTGLLLNNTYSVQVRVYFNNAWGSYGNVCNVTTPASNAISPPSSTVITARSENNSGNIIESANNLFNVITFPNPFNDQFTLNINSSDQETVLNIRVYDVTGRIIESHVISPKDITELKIGNEYPSGIYNIMVNQGSEVKNLKVIKN
jgi:autotransporter-associated beta strand protein